MVKFSVSLHTVFWTVWGSCCSLLVARQRAARLGFWWDGVAACGGKSTLKREDSGIGDNRQDGDGVVLLILMSSRSEVLFLCWCVTLSLTHPTIMFLCWWVTLSLMHPTIMFLRWWATLSLTHPTNKDFLLETQG